MPSTRGAINEQTQDHIFEWVGMSCMAFASARLTDLETGSLKAVVFLYSQREERQMFREAKSVVLHDAKVRITAGGWAHWWGEGYEAWKEKTEEDPSDGFLSEYHEVSDVEKIKITQSESFPNQYTIHVWYGPDSPFRDEYLYQGAISIFWEECS